jgi:proline racemase
VPVMVGNRAVHADVAFGGAFYAIVDSEAVGIPILPERLPDLRKAGMEIKHAIEKALKVEHPLEPQLHGIYGTIFTGPPSDESADLRNVTIFADAEVDRSPCGTGTAAVMAVLAAMGMLTEGEQVFTHESIIGTRFRGRVVGTTTISAIEAIIPEIEGEAYITGENTFLIDDRDPLRHGFRL